MPLLTIELKIPLEYEQLIGAPALTFSHWLPIGKKNGIEILENDFKILLWFDIKTTWWASQPKEEEIPNHVNVLAHYINATITTEKIDENLANYMQHRDFSSSPNESEKNIQLKYEQVGQEILEIVLTRVNRLISYARDFKGQYWLLKYDNTAKHSLKYFQKFSGRGKFDNKEQFRFQPGAVDVVHVSIGSEEKYLTEEEWESVRKFVSSDGRTPLVGELLAGAEQLEGNGYGRSALTEAITALEVSIAEFGASENANKQLSSFYCERLGIESLKKQIERMGLSGTVNLLLPLILPETILPTEIVKECQKAITLRQNVVHNGQRNVNPIAIRIGILNIKKCCNILNKYKLQPSISE